MTSFNYYNYEKLNITSPKKPSSVHTIAETNSSGTFYAVESGATTKIIKSTNKMESWSTVTTRTYDIFAILFDKANDLLYCLEVRYSGGTDDVTEYVFTIDITDDSITELGNTGGELWTNNRQRDIFIIGSDIYITFGKRHIPGSDNIHIYKHSAPSTWTSVANYNTTTNAFPDMRSVVVAGTNAYFLIEGTTVNLSFKMLKFD